jgi:hypothetical protein
MKYIITEEQAKQIDQSKIDMGPLGPSIKSLIDLFQIPLIDRYVIIYIKDNDSYLILLWSKRGYISSEFSWELTKQVEKYIPANITIVSGPLS